MFLLPSAVNGAGSALNDCDRDCSDMVPVWVVAVLIVIVVVMVIIMVTLLVVVYLMQHHSKVEHGVSNVCYSGDDGDKGSEYSCRPSHSRSQSR